MRHTPSWTDRTRQLATLGGATSFVALGATGDYDEHGELRSPVVPTPGAFSIWGPIYLGNLALVANQALPSKATDPLMQDLGWPLALAYGGAGVWSRAFELRNLPVSLGLVATTTASAAIAYHRLPATGGDWREQWLVRVPVGLLFGWLTVAAAAATTEELLAPDVTDLDLEPEKLAIATIATVGAVAGAVTIGMDRTLAYPAAVAWGLGGIVLAQRDQRPAVAAAAGFALVGLGVASLVTLIRRRSAARRRIAPVGRSSWIPADELYAST